MTRNGLSNLPLKLFINHVTKMYTINSFLPKLVIYLDFVCLSLFRDDQQIALQPAYPPFNSDGFAQPS